MFRISSYLLGIGGISGQYYLVLVGGLRFLIKVGGYKCITHAEK